MLLIYADNTSPRLQYICRFIFEEVLKISFSLTRHAESFVSYEGVKINYSQADVPGAYSIVPHQLLFETGISDQPITSSGEGAGAVFFKNTEGDHPFDIFCAAFFLLSRYEEYLPHEKDMYGRYAHENSTAFHNGFLDIPIINNWIRDLADKLRRHSPLMPFNPATFNFLPTYDIDMAWSYKEKGIIRNAAGFLIRPERARLSVLSGFRADPFDSYGFLDTLHSKYALQPLYFFLVAEKNGIYDKNILPSNKAMQGLIRSHVEKYNIGLHPSWQTFENVAILTREKSMLENISRQKITAARGHYIKMSLPGTYTELSSAGITDDYSMGYGSINGFRASVASSFFWYDLSEEKVTTLRVHPFCFMDANCFYEEKLSPEESYSELMHYYTTCRDVGGTLITVFHNNFLGTDKQFAGWRELYTAFISQLP